MRLAAAILICGLTLAAQTAVEYGVGASRAATSTAPAKGLGKSISGVLGGLDKALKSQPPPAGAPSGTSVAPVNRGRGAPSKRAETALAAAPVYEDLKKAEVGLSYPELVRRFGPPAIEFAASAGGKTLTYSGQGGFTQIEIRNDKVVSIATAGQSASVVLK